MRFLTKFRYLCVTTAKIKLFAMKRALLLLIFFSVTLSTLCEAAPQKRARRPRGRDYRFQTWSLDERGDSIPHIYSYPIYVYSKGIDTRKWRRLVAAVKAVYPVAQLAREKMAEMEAELAQLPTKKAQKEYIKGIYDEIKAEYTPILKKMTRTQGRVLLKLIDRETDHTAYEILREFRGSFIAGFWQTIGKVFGHDLKDDYDKTGEDRMIEQIVVYYEAGLI